MSKMTIGVKVTDAVVRTNGGNCSKHLSGIPVRQNISYKRVSDGSTCGFKAKARAAESSVRLAHLDTVKTARRVLPGIIAERRKAAEITLG